MAPRPLWSGTISFGLVTVPVRVFSAISEHKLQFHLVHAPDNGQIGYSKVCKLEDKPVPDDEIVKAFELRKGELVQMSDEDFELARAAAKERTIEITDFVPYKDIDPIFFAKAYYVGPGTGGDHVYALLARAMQDSGLAAIAKFVMRDRQHLGALRVDKGLIVLEQLYFADEQRPTGEIRPGSRRVSKPELEMAAKLIDSYKGQWRPEKYKDTYRDELCALIKAKRRGAAPPEAVEKTEGPADLMEALRQSLQAGRSPAPRKSRSKGSRSSTSARSRKRAAR
jgi:DNA end-binding protein Ku